MDAMHGGGAVSNEVRKSTQMENLCERLGGSLQRLRDIHDRQTNTISRFCNEPIVGGIPGSDKPSPQAAPAPPGTLGCLNDLADKIEAEVVRAFNIAKRHGDLIG